MGLMPAPLQSSSVTHLRVLQASQVGVKVEFDAFGCPGQRHSSHQQHDQHHKGEGCRYVHHLDGTAGGRAQRTHQERT